MDNATITRDQLVADAKVVLDDVESLLRQAAAASGQQAQELRERASDTLRSAREKLQDAQIAVAANARAAAHATDDWVHEHPWSAVGIGAGVGFLLGLLVSRR